MVLKKITKESVILLLLGLIVYMPFMAGQLNNADGFTNGVLYHGDNYGWEDAQGRFFLRFFDLWRDGMIVPEVIVFVSIVMISVAIFLLWQTLDIQKEIERILIGALVLFSPSVANLFTYYYCADAYCLAFLFAVIAAYLLIKNTKYSLGIAVVLLVISMGIYQTYVGVTISICGIWIIKEILNNQIEIKTLIGKTISFAIGVVGAAISYLGLFKFLEVVGYLKPTGTRGMNNMLGNMIGHLSDMIRMAYGVFYDYFFTDNIINNSWRFRRTFNFAICVATILLILFIIYKKQVYRSFLKLIILVGAIAVFPIMLTVIVILAPEANVYAETGMLMLAYMNLLYILPIAVLGILSDEVKERIIGFGIYTLSSIMIVIMVLFIGVFVRTIELEQTKIQHLAYQMENRIENIEGYAADMTVLVVGRPHNGNYPFVSHKLHDITKGMISRYSLTFGMAEQVSNSWIQLFQYYCGVNYTECDKARREEIITSDEFKHMGNFPEQTSVKKIGDVIVVKLSMDTESIIGMR